MAQVPTAVDPKLSLPRTAPNQTQNQTRSKAEREQHNPSSANPMPMHIERVVSIVGCAVRVQQRRSAQTRQASSAAALGAPFCVLVCTVSSILCYEAATGSGLVLDSEHNARPVQHDTSTKTQKRQQAAPTGGRAIRVQRGTPLTPKA